MSTMTLDSISLVALFAAVIGGSLVAWYFMSSTRDRNRAILLTVSLSLLFGVVFASLLLFLNILHSYLNAAIIALIFSLLNPVFGKVFVSLGLFLCNAVDKAIRPPIASSKKAIGRRCGAGGHPTRRLYLPQFGLLPVRSSS